MSLVLFLAPWWHQGRIGAGCTEGLALVRGMMNVQFTSRRRQVLIDSMSNNFTQDIGLLLMGTMSGGV